MSRPTRLLTLGMASLALIAVVFTGCSRTQESKIVEHIKHGLAIFHRGRPLLADLHPVAGGWIIRRISTDIDTLNPITLDTDDAAQMSKYISESLINVNDFTYKIDPCLAESWEVSPDQLTYTFHLRHGVKWHDGQPFTADDVKYSYDRVMDPKVDCPFLRVYFANIKSCEILDPYTVRFAATEKYFKTLEILGSFIKIVPKHAFANSTDFNSDPFGRNPIGTGPYKFVRWVTGSQIVFERNDDYWDKAHPRYPERLVYEIVQESYIAAQLLKKGEIDILDNVSPIIWTYDLDHSRAMDKCRQIIYSYPSYNYLGFNMRNPLFSDIRVRHAIDLLIPRDAMLAKIYLGIYAKETSGYEPPGSPSYNSAVPPTANDPVAAQQLLTDAGWKNDHGDGLLYKEGKPLTFTLLYRAGNANEQKLVELIQEALAKSGIEVKLSRLEFAQWVDRVQQWKFEATMGAWALDEPNGDPAQIWSSEQADIKNSSNYGGYKSEAADRLIAAAKLEYDAPKRYAIYQQLHQVVHDDYPVCFLFSPNFIMLISDRFHNVKLFVPRPCFDPGTWWTPHYRQRYANYQ